MNDEASAADVTEADEQPANGIDLSDTVKVKTLGKAVNYQGVIVESRGVHGDPAKKEAQGKEHGVFVIHRNELAVLQNIHGWVQKLPG